MNKYGLKAGATVVSLMLSLVSLGGVVKADSAVELTNQLCFCFGSWYDNGGCGQYN